MQKTWPEYPPSGARPKLGVGWIILIGSAAMFAGAMWYAISNPETPAAGSHEASSAAVAEVTTVDEATDPTAALATDPLMAGLFGDLDNPGGGSVRRDLPFDQCVEFINSSPAFAGSTPTDVLSTEDMRITRLNFESGSVLLTCSRADNSLTIMQSPRKG